MTDEEIMCILPSAHYMRTETESAIRKAYDLHMQRVAVQLKELLEQMDKAAEHSKFSVQIMMNLLDETTSIVKQKGYQIKWISSGDGGSGIPTYEISWELEIQ